MHPKNRMERGIALKAIAETAKELQNKGADSIEVTNFIQGARQKLAEERPDIEQRKKARDVAASWATK